MAVSDTRACMIAITQFTANLTQLVVAELATPLELDTFTKSINVANAQLVDALIKHGNRRIAT